MAQTAMTMEKMRSEMKMMQMQMMMNSQWLAAQTAIMFPPPTVQRRPIEPKWNESKRRRDQVQRGREASQRVLETFEAMLMAAESSVKVHQKDRELLADMAKLMEKDGDAGDEAFFAVDAEDAARSAARRLGAKRAKSSAKHKTRKGLFADRHVDPMVEPAMRIFRAYIAMSLSESFDKLALRAAASSVGYKLLDCPETDTKAVADRGVEGRKFLAARFGQRVPQVVTTEATNFGRQDVAQETGPSGNAKTQTPTVARHRMRIGMMTKESKIKFV